MRKLLPLIGAVAAFVLLVPFAAQAFWGPGEKCWRAATNEGHHCYAEEHWKMSGYPTVMHGRFMSQDVPNGAEPTSGTVMDVITEAHTGSIEMVHIGQSAPASAELTPVSTTEGHALASVAVVRRGVIEGRLVESTSPRPGFKSTTRPLAGWTVVVAKGKLSELTAQSSPNIVARVKTHEGGRFALHMKSGTYIVAGVWRAHPPSVNDEICAGVHVKVRTMQRSRVTVGCNGV